MNIVFLGKLLFSGGFAAIASTFVWWNWDQITRPPYRDIVVYTKISAPEDADKVTNTDIDTKKNDVDNNYRCRFENTTYLFTCNIKQLKDSYPSKNQIDYADFEDTVSDKKALAKDKIFYISFKSNKYVWKNDGTEKIEIVSVDTAADKGKKYGITGIWFIEEKDKEITTKYFIVKAKSTATQSSIASYKCSWAENVQKTDAKSCEVYVFDSSTSSSQTQSTDYSSLTFAKPDKISTSISEHNHYLVKWEEKQYADSHKDKMTIFATTNVEDASEEKIQFEKIKPSFLVDDKLLIVNKKPS